MHCKDLLSMEQLKDSLHLVAGEQGLGRSVRWIYFADCIECVKDQDNLAQWIHGGELVIVTNLHYLKSEERMLDMMRQFNRKTAAGFVVNVEEASDALRQLADTMDMPLFELDWNLKTVDLSQIICFALVEEAKNETNISEIFSTILYQVGFSAADVVRQGEYYGLELEKPHFVAAFDIDHLTTYIKENKLPQERRKSCKQSLLSTIKMEFYMAGLSKILTTLQSDAVLALIPEEAFDHAKLDHIIRKIQNEFVQKNKMTVSVGLGSSYEQLQDFSKSATEANHAVQQIRSEGAEQKIVRFEEIGIFYFISRIKDTGLLERYYLELLQPLLESDHYSDGNLCETLEMYLKHNKNGNETAEAMYIHRNTMRYRLDKITKLLRRDLNSMDFCTELNFAFHIKNYLSGQKQTRPYH